MLVQSDYADHRERRKLVRRCYTSGALETTTGPFWWYDEGMSRWRQVSNELWHRRLQQARYGAKGRDAKHVSANCESEHSLI